MNRRHHGGVAVKQNEHGDHVLHLERVVLADEDGGE